MKKQYKLGIIGCGVMAKAILRGVFENDFLRSKKIIVSDLLDENLSSVAFDYGVNVTKDNRYVAENSEYLLLAVQPQIFYDIAEKLRGVSPEKVISIMAGVKKATIKNSFGVGLIKVARCMPNLPASVGLGMTAVDVTDFNSNSDDCDFVFNLLSTFGRVLSVTEEKLDAVTGISGSGPAYTFVFIDSLIDAGVKQGLTRDEAKLLAMQTVWGSCSMLMESEKPLNEMIMSVCSKGGSTIEAIKVLEENDFRGIVSSAVEACVNRSKELSNK